MPGYTLESGDIVEIAFYATLYEQTIINQFHYRLTGGFVAGGGPDELVNILGTVGGVGPDSLLAAIAACQSEDLFYNFGRIQVVEDSAGGRRPPIYRSLGVSTGGVAEPSLPSHVDMSFTRQCEVARGPSLAAGRGVTSNIRLAGIPVSGVTGDRLTAGQLALLAAASDKSTDVIPSGDIECNPVIWHKNPATLPRYDDIIDGYANDIVRTQRTRLLRSVV